jgi:nitrogen fixation-related uncharacterized protein
MEWFFIEAGVALVIGIAIVWWTTRALRRDDDDDDDKRD